MSRPVRWEMLAAAVLAAAGAILAAWVFFDLVIVDESWGARMTLMGRSGTGLLAIALFSLGLGGITVYLLQRLR